MRIAKASACVAACALIGAPGASSAGAPIVVPWATINSVVADFVPDIDADTWTMRGWATWSHSGPITEIRELMPTVRLVFSVAVCDAASKTNIVEHFTKTYVRFGGPALPWDVNDMDLTDRTLCDESLARQGYPRIAWKLPIATPPLKSRMRDVTISVETNSVESPVGSLRIQYRLKQLSKATSRTIWEGSDSFWNTCVRGDYDVKMRSGRKYCVVRTPAEHRLSMSFVGSRVLGITP
jgi:hypothetical protein